jgi:transcriptional regulator
MYVPSQFEETRSEVMQQLMHEHALGALVTLGSTGLNANHVPFEFDPDPAPFGTLRAHVARSNPVWQDFDRKMDSIVIFQGPQAYISPSWYATKKEGGRVVPTYNYMVVHAYGQLRAIDDPAWVRGLLERLTARHETGMAEPWKLIDAPAEYIEKLLSAIVGIEIPITRLVGKWKVSQNQPKANRAGVEAGLRTQGDENALAMAAAVARR